MGTAVGGSVKRSLAMVFLGCGATIANACGLGAATRMRLNTYSREEILSFAK
jgi:hypothetical protein